MVLRWCCTTYRWPEIWTTAGLSQVPTNLAPIEDKWLLKSTKKNIQQRYHPLTTATSADRYVAQPDRHTGTGNVMHHSMTTGGVSSAHQVNQSRLLSLLAAAAAASASLSFFTLSTALRAALPTALLSNLAWRASAYSMGMQSACGYLQWACNAQDQQGAQHLCAGKAGLTLLHKPLTASAACRLASRSAAVGC